MATLNYLHIVECVYLIIYPGILLHGNGVWPLWDKVWVVCVKLHFVTCVVPILVSSCVNCDLNVFNWFSDFLTLCRRVCKGGVKVSGWACSSIIFCVVRLLIEVCGIWSMGGSIWPMHCPLLNVTCLYKWLQDCVKLICLWCYKFHQFHGCLDQVPCWCADYW